MSERYFSSILDTSIQPKAALDKAGSTTAEKSAKSEVILTKEEDIRLRGYLIAAKAKEQAGDLKAALELYTLYRQEFLAIKNRGKSVEILSPEYLEALAEVFKGETLDNTTLPEPKELTSEYFDKMYPATQREEDIARGLVSYRPGWWNNEIEKSISPKKETIGSAYIRSMISQAAQLQGSLLFTESIQKPNFTDGSQQYGTKEGADATIDPLLPVIHEVFGPKANRFNLSWDQITNELLPKVKEKITAALIAKGLPIPDFDVILTPALASNQQMTNLRPENSQTNSYEWTSTVLLKQDGADSGHRLMSGHSEDGGAGCVRDDPRAHWWAGRGFRLSVVFKK